FGEADEWYRYHTLFAEAMQYEATRRFGAEALRSLYRRATDWYEAHDMLPDAVEGLMKATDHSRAACLIERIVEGETFTKNHGFYTLRRWLEQLPEQIIYQHPNLCFDFARTLLYTRAPRTLPNLAQMESLLQVAENSWQAQGDAVRLSKSLVFRSVFALLRGEHTDIISSVRQALRSLP